MFAPQYWSEDRNNDGLVDRLHFQQHLETAMAHNLSSIEWMLLLEAQLNVINYIKMY